MSTHQLTPLPYVAYLFLLVFFIFFFLVALRCTKRVWPTYREDEVYFARPHRHVHTTQHKTIIAELPSVLCTYGGDLLFCTCAPRRARCLLLNHGGGLSEWSVRQDWMSRESGDGVCGVVILNDDDRRRGTFTHSTISTFLLLFWGCGIHVVVE